MLELIFEDNHQLVVSKPAGILTQPSGTTQWSLEEEAKAWVKKKYQKQGNVFLEAVYRLDKPVSGLVLFAKTSKALSRLHAMIREKKNKKLYLALVEEHMSLIEGKLENYLIHDEFRAKVVNENLAQAKKAILYYRELERREEFSLIEISLETGRYHQIRAQLSYTGHPIVGDEKYGSKLPFPNGIALHHYLLEIPHPITGEMQKFTSLPEWR